MNKEAFLQQLAELLSGISEEERADALAFYRSYFEDAGEENEASIMAELESPQKVADSILKNMGIDAQSKAREDGRDDNLFGNRDAEYYQKVNQAEPQSNANDQKQKRSTGMTVFMVVLIILASPVWLTLLLLAASAALGVVCLLFGMALAVIGVMLALICTGIVLAGVGIAEIFTGSPAIGFGLAGGGCIVLALGILAVLLVVWVCGGCLPWAVKGIWNLCKKPFDKRKERAAV